MKRKKLAFTLVELLAVLGIIAVLVALLIPALAMVRKMAKETQQKAQLTTIEMGLTAFKNDIGDYPRSQGTKGDGSDDYSGAQMLAEALVGWDLMGFHPDSKWDSDGTAYKPQPPSEENLKKRLGPYLELATADAFRLNQLFSDTGGQLAPNTFVLCDVFGIKSVTIGGKTIKAGAPILYYKANTSSKKMDGDVTKRIYNVYDNYELVFVKEMADRERYPGHTSLNPLAGSPFSPGGFYYYIADPKVSTTTIKWPYRPDSYILISAGADGFYGTSDDICNF